MVEKFDQPLDIFFSVFLMLQREGMLLLLHFLLCSVNLLIQQQQLSNLAA